MRFFPREKGENGLFKEKPWTKAIFAFSRGKNRISQGVENRGSLISVPLALREFMTCSTFVFFLFFPMPFVGMPFAAEALHLSK